jgi:hypothetical protein
MVRFVDDAGAAVPLASEVSRIVSLVPSLTEALALSCPEKLVAATDWCTHPADLVVARVRGTKNPNLEAIRALAPDLVVANAEENREVDLDVLRGQGIPVWVTDIRTVDQALDSIETLLRAVGAGDTRWLGQARDWWAQTPAVVEGRRLRAVVPIWRRPWMHLGGDTYAGDVLGRLGVDNVLGEGPERYPEAGAWAGTRGGSGGVAGRALPVHRGGWAGGVSRRAVCVGQRGVPDLVWAGHGRGAARTARIAACSAGLIRSRRLPTWEKVPRPSETRVLLPCMRTAGRRRP